MSLGYHECLCKKDNNNKSDQQTDRLTDIASSELDPDDLSCQDKRVEIWPFHHSHHYTGHRGQDTFAEAEHTVYKRLLMRLQVGLFISVRDSF